MRSLQTETIDRNRADSLLLLRIQNNLNSLALTMRDMLDQQEPYPLTAWQAQFRRIRCDLEDALAREEKVSPATARISADIWRDSLTQFWDALDRIFALARPAGRRKRRARGSACRCRRGRRRLSTAVARLLVQNNESEQQAAARDAADLCAA